jgi:hypothetical protein
MDKLEALKKEFPDAELIVQLDDIMFKVDDETYSLRDDDELERDALKSIRDIWEDLSEIDFERESFLQRNGGYENFYNEEYINDFRIEDSDTFGDMSDEEIIEYLNEIDYFAGVPSKEAIDTDKVVNYIYDVDGAECLSRIDGSIEYISGYHLILEDY